MAQAVPNPPSERKRVKVYELRNNDWFDRGTGFCSAAILTHDDGRTEPQITVDAEETPERLLLETKISGKDGFQKQQDTLIVWTEPVTGVDMALSFQEAEGCAAIWRFVNSVQNFSAGAPDDALDDDLTVDPFHNIALPNPELGSLKEVEEQMRTLSNTNLGRDALTKFILQENYILKLTPLVELAEDFESLEDLHRLCNIMKIMILLNDSAIMEYAVTDELILGVVGALEYDPDFPSHKANHRQWLADESRYKEVVPIADEGIQKKVHYTYRLQYLKDVVLARILDDPTFSILNSLIFYYQVDIVQYVQTTPSFLKELFGIFTSQEAEERRRKDAVLFIQQCCAIAKNLQPATRLQLYNNFLAHGLLAVIKFALQHQDVAVRVGATDVLVAMIDHDPQMIRQTILRQMGEKQVPLTDTLIDLILVETDLGVKAQIADVIKVVLDGASHAPLEGLAKANGEFASRVRATDDPQQQLFLENFYGAPAKRLFKPLLDLPDVDSMDFTVNDSSLFVHLIEILCFFIRQHGHKVKAFVLGDNLCKCIAQLLRSPEKHLQLTALKFFRNLISLQDEFYNNHMIAERLFEPILDVVYATMPRDNLLNSACLEFFDFIKRESVKPLIHHLVENYREKLETMGYVETFSGLVVKYDQMPPGFPGNMETSFLDTEEDTPQRPRLGNRRWDGVKDLDPAEEEYFNTSDDEEEQSKNSYTGRLAATPEKARSRKPLVDYPSDEEAEMLDAEADSEKAEEVARDEGTSDKEESGVTLAFKSAPPPERLSEKRRREEDEEDELEKLVQQHTKRRNSTSSNSSTGSATSNASLRKKKSFSNAKEGGVGAPRRMHISITPAIKSGGGDGGKASGDGS